MKSGGLEWGWVLLKVAPADLSPSSSGSLPQTTWPAWWSSEWCLPTWKEEDVQIGGWGVNFHTRTNCTYKKRCLPSPEALGFDGGLWAADCGQEGERPSQQHHESSYEQTDGEQCDCHQSDLRDRRKEQEGLNIRLNMLCHPGRLQLQSGSNVSPIWPGMMSLPLLFMYDSIRSFSHLSFSNEENFDGDQSA